MSDTRRIDATVHELFRSAVAAIDRRFGWARAEGFTNSTSALQESARCLADAFLVARGCERATDAERIELLTKQPIIDRETDKPLIELLRFEPRNEWSERQARELNALEQQYRALLPRFRSTLADETPGYKRATEHCKFAARTKWARTTVAGLAATVLLSVASYQWADPGYRLSLGGKVYWKQTPDEPFTEERSRAFAVNVDNKKHDYVIRFRDPISITRLRLDPVNSVRATEVEIQRIQLLDSNGNIDDVYTELTSWACTNCRWLSKSGHGIRLKPENDDPFVTGPSVDPVEVSRIRVTMRASAKKSFWEWITQPDKTAN